MKKVFFFWILLTTILGQAQTKVSGVVIDSLTKEPVSFAKVLFMGTTDGGLTNFEGKFAIQTTQEVDSIVVSFVGYNPKKIAIPKATEDQKKMLIELNSVKLLNEVEVIADKKNPVFRILKEINDHRPINDPEKLEAYQYEVYNKMQFSLTNLGENPEDIKLIKNFNFVTDYIDTLNGKDFLPILLTEAVTDYYYKKSPAQKKEIIKATNVTGVENLQVEQFTGDMNQNVNIYDNYISLFNKDFLSPIAPTARAFYKYYLLGHEMVNDVECYRIQFVPRRKGDAVFFGEMWVTVDTYAIVRIEADIPDDVNLNYVSNFKVKQLFTLTDSNIYMVDKEEVFAEFKLFNEMKKQSLVGVYVHKNTYRKDFVINDPKDFSFYVEDIVIPDSAKIKDQAYWQTIRHDSLNANEAGVIEMIDSLKQNRTFKFYDQLAYMSYTGFWRAGPMEIGNIFSMYNKNVVEGQRVMLSLRTSNKFSTKHEINAFLIYGFGDQRFKYGASYRWRLKRSPRTMLRFAYNKKIEQLGLSSRLGDIGNSFTTLFSIGPLDKLTFVDKASVSLEKDYPIDMRTFSAIEWKNFVPLGNSVYHRLNDNGDSINVSSVTSFEIRNQIMYTKDEKFINGNFDRFSLGSKYPIISLTHTLGIKNVFGSEYNFNRLDFLIDHRPKVGFWGRINYTLYAGKIFGTLPYPFLNIHQGNQTFYLQTGTFNLLNYYEFVSDTWVGLNFEHRLQGFILDKVPLIRKLKWRLVYGAKGVIGTFDQKHLSEMLLPSYTKTLSFTKPYMEASIGVENIFKFIRIDAIWRLSYLDTPNITKFGVKFTFTGDF
ncbi:MAG: DUF5686 family protein [Putridiphycobacter sp.]